MTERLKLEVSRREGTGKGPARRLRAAGLIPGIVYGEVDGTIPVTIDPKLLEPVLRTEYGFNNVFELSIDGGESLLCMVKERQFDSVRRALTHLDFLVVRPDRYVAINVPVTPLGKSEGEKAGGRLMVVAREVKLRVQVKDIPAAVEHDISALNISEQVYIDEMTPPQGAEFVFRHRFPVLRVARKRGAKVGAEAAEETAEA
ncbi:MAG: 50S ribosomal protein L25 [Deltaproteobacteria bacterium]|nr:MAG: 50S ribosomal protein L25 [Deltaproteobacteria bacterium]